MLAPPVGGTYQEKYLPLLSLVAGTTTGGALLGMVMAGAWYGLEVSEPARTGLVMALSVFAITAVLRPQLRRWIPNRSCQVPNFLLLAHRLETVAFRWGLELGAGLCTFMVTPGLLGLFAIALGQNGGVAAGLLFVVYGTTRGAAIATFGSLESHRQHRERVGFLGRIGNLERILRLPLVAAIALAGSLEAT